MRAYREALTVLHGLREIGNDPSMSEKHGDTHQNFADLLSKLERHPEAQEEFHKARLIWERLLEKHPNLGATLNNLALSMEKQERFADSRPLMARAIRHQEFALTSEPQNRTYRDFLCNHHLVLARILLKLKDVRSDEDYMAAQNLGRCIPYLRNEWTAPNDNERRGSLTCTSN